MKPKYIFLRVLIVASTIMGMVACSEPTKDEESTPSFVGMLKSAIDIPTNTQEERKAKQQKVQSLLLRIKEINPDCKHKPTTKDELISFIQAEIWGQGKDGYQLWSADLNNIDTSLITDMRFLFGNFSEGSKTYGYKLHLFNGDIGDWNVSRVTDMTGMFINATSFNKDISDWVVSRVTNMSAMFGSARAFNQDISGWDVRKVIDMKYIFSGAEAFKQEIGKWDVSRVTNMKYMFSDATAFNQDISGWDVSRVTDMQFMFYGATAFNQDIRGWDVSSVTSMRDMFKSAYLFNQDLDTWDVRNLENAKRMFQEATSFNGNITTWKLKKIEDMTEMFQSAKAFDQDLNIWDRHLKNADGIYRKIRTQDMFIGSGREKKPPRWLAKIPK